MLEIKAITLHQPWASLIAMGHKQFETRSFPIKYRGPFAIHAAKRKPKALERSIYQQVNDKYYGGNLPDIDTLPLGKVVATCRVVDCRQITSEFIGRQKPSEKVVGDWGVGRYGWKLMSVLALPEPFDHKGLQGLHNLSAAEIDEVRRQQPSQF